MSALLFLSSYLLYHFFLLCIALGVYCKVYQFFILFKLIFGLHIGYLSQAMLSSQTNDKLNNKQQNKTMQHNTMHINERYQQQAMCCSIFSLTKQHNIQ